MSKSTEKFLLILSDLLFINLAWIFYYVIRVKSEWISFANPPAFLAPMIAVYFFWLIVFSFAGLYQHWYVRSRFDEFSAVFKAVSIGTFLLFFLIYIDDISSNAPVISRYIILIYWILMIICVGFGRIIIRGVQRNLLQKGIGLRNTLIIGNGQKAKDLGEMINKFPQLGYKVLGYVGVNNRSGVNIISNLENTSQLIEEKSITEILIALEPDEKEKLIDVIKYSSGERINLKILPDMYEIVSGMAKTNQIYGVPLIEVMPDIMSPTAKLTKRIIDVTISLLTLVIFLPFFLVLAILIKITSKGPVFYTQERIGRGGAEFILFKFRSMIENAEEYGPEWAGEDDSRITGIGKFMRRIYIDEIPQMINVLKNEMSLIGPRPERPFFVEQLKNEIPYYYKRLSVKPGITGWAQIKHKYDSSFDDVKTKLQYDFYYIENMSLKLDLKILINTVIVILLMKGR